MFFGSLLVWQPSSLGVSSWPPVHNVLLPAWKHDCTQLAAAKMVEAPACREAVLIQHQVIPQLRRAVAA